MRVHSRFGRKGRTNTFHVRLGVLAACFAVAPGAAAQAVAGAPPADPPPIQPGLPPPPGAYAPGIDVLHYDVEIHLLHPEPRVRGRARLRVHLLPGRIDPLVLDFTGLHVDAVRAGGRPVAFRHLDGRLHVPLPLWDQREDTVMVEVEYQGAPDDGLVLGPTTHGRAAAFADNWPNRARFWFPSVDHPSDKATVRFQVHAPSSWSVVANGRLTSPPLRWPGATRPFAPGVVAGQDGSAQAPGDEAERLLWRWRTTAPIPVYTMVFGATEFEIQDLGLAACGRAPRSPREDGCVEVSVWMFPEDTARAPGSFLRAAEMLDFFAERVGPFPYEKLAHVQAATRFGGMENASAVFYSQDAVTRGRGVEATVAHETAHQWFGNAVTPAEWSHLWLSEGFASYFGALFFEHADGSGRFREILERSRAAYLASDAGLVPVVHADVESLFDLLNANNYQKGAWILHMLRGLVGDDAFFEGVREYYRRHADGTALTSHFRAAMEVAAGRDLGWFFDQWLHRPGHPVLGIDWIHDEESGLTELTVTQRQREREATWPLFRFPLTLEVRLPGGATHREAVDVTARVTSLRIRLPEPPEAVVTDPDGWLLADRLATPDAEPESEPPPPRPPEGP